MNLTQQLERELGRLAVQGGLAEPRRIVMDVDGGRLECQIAAADSIGCSFRRLTYHTPKLADTTAERLKELSTALSQRLHYLLEPIAVVEVDPEHCVVQMRSKPPSQEDDGSYYYELVAKRGGELTLCRYHKAAGEVRQVVDAHVTRQVFYRLAQDLTQVLA